MSRSRPFLKQSASSCGHLRRSGRESGSKSMNQLRGIKREKAAWHQSKFETGTYIVMNVPIG